MTPVADLLPDRHHGNDSTGVFDLFVFSEDLGRDALLQISALPDANVKLPRKRVEFLLHLLLFLSITETMGVQFFFSLLRGRFEPVKLVQERKNLVLHAAVLLLKGFDLLEYRLIFLVRLDLKEPFPGPFQGLLPLLEMDVLFPPAFPKG